METDSGEFINSFLGSFDASLAQRGFFNDILIAASAREIGATVITKNLTDFAIIARVLDVRFSPPWPQSAQ